MRKVHAAALGAAAIVAVGAVGAASGAAAQGPTKVHGKVAVFATPVNTLDSKGKSKTTSVTVTGKVKTQVTCQSRRKIQFTEVTPSGSYTSSVTAVTTRKGSFTAAIPFDSTGLKSSQNGSAITVSATAIQVSRKDKDSGQKVRCLEATGINDFTVAL